jgi:hypothetical protein
LQAAHPTGRLTKASVFKLALVKSSPRNQTNEGLTANYREPFFFFREKQAVLKNTTSSKSPKVDLIISDRLALKLLHNLFNK